MKGVAFADVHAHPHRGYGGVSSDDRLKHCTGAMWEVLKYATARKLPVFFLGDLFHTKGSLPVKALNGVLAVCEYFKGLEVYAIPGNHDMIDDEHALYFWEALGATVFDRPTVKSMGGVIGEEIGFIPFIRGEAKLREAIFNILNGKETPPPKVIMAHQWVHELMRLYAGVDGDISALELGCNADLLLLGHMHGFAQIDLPRDKKPPLKVVSVGALLPHNFGDSGVRGFIEFDTDTMEIKHIPVKTPTFVKAVSWPCGGIEGAFVRAKASSPKEAEKMRASMLEAGALGVDVEIVPKEKKTRIDLSPGSTDAEILVRYTESEWGKTSLDLPELLRVGLRYLEGES